MISHTTKGLIAEHLVASTILGFDGWQCSLAQQDKVDLIAWKEKRYVRVQVKSASLRPYRNRYHFNLGSGSKKKTLPTVEDYDVLCFVALDARGCYFLPTEHVRNKTKWFSPTFFDDRNIEIESWNETMKVIDERLR